MINLTAGANFSFDNMKRCSKCILPETYPKITFNENGVCNYCINHTPITSKGEEALLKVLDKYRKNDGSYECIVPISGGRDSSFVLYYLVKKIKIKVLALTVDHGFLLPLAFKNIENITKSLNLDHQFIKIPEKKILTSKNNTKIKFRGWVKKPSINTIIPVINAGDKTMNHLMAKFAYKRDIHVIFGGNIVGTTEFEHDYFKLGYMGIFPNYKWKFSFTEKLNINLHYFLEFIKNPYNFHYSIFIEYFLGALVFFYEDLIKPPSVDFIGFWDYIYWNEKNIINTITEELNWQKASDTTTTWRIDDAAYPLINYLYLTIVGFTEHDELYSKMIREGQIDRETALKKCLCDHKPRLDIIEDNLKFFNINKKDLDHSLEIYRNKFLQELLKNNSKNISK